MFYDTRELYDFILMLSK